MFPVARALARHPLVSDAVDLGGPAAAGQERVLMQTGVEEGEGGRRLEVLRGRQGGVLEASLELAKSVRISGISITQYNCIEENKRGSLY